jgi:hypothetical protein
MIRRHPAQVAVSQLVEDRDLLSPQDRLIHWINAKSSRDNGAIGKPKIIMDARFRVFSALLNPVPDPMGWNIT